MPELVWKGKAAIVEHHLEVPVCELVPVFVCDAKGVKTTADAQNCNDAQNRILHGDNLLALKALLPEYENRIKCIYIDPPYNTGNEAWVYNDSVNSPEMRNWLGRTVGKAAEDLNRHDKWLCMLYPRLKLLHQLLADDGAIFISIDDNEQHHLRMICDEIFGERNFLANLVWENKEGGGSSDSKYFRVKHEYIISYAKNIALTTINGVSITNEDRYKSKDEHYKIRGPFYLQKLGMGSIQYSKSLDYPIITPDNTPITATEGNNNKKACWRWGIDKYNWGVENDFVVLKKDTKNQWQVYTKQYLNCDNEGNIIVRTNRPMGVINNYSSTQASKSLEKLFEVKVFDYSKPVDLVAYLLELASDENAIILDSFAGSGTTAHAVINLNKDGGNRKYILVQMDETDKTGNTVNIAETITAERVRRVLANKAAEGEGELNLSSRAAADGFVYYDIGPALFLENENIEPLHTAFTPIKNINPAASAAALRQYVWYTETRNASDAAPAVSACIRDESGEAAFYLGLWQQTAYYFCYDGSSEYVLDWAFLQKIVQERPENAHKYCIFADNCLLPDDLLLQYGITFKKIPRHIVAM